MKTNTTGQILSLYLYNVGGVSKLSYTPLSGDPQEVFYVIDPDIKPLPYGSELFCVEQDDSGIKNISEMYDPFNQDRKCLRFLGWNDPAPYTTPVYIYRKSNGILLTEEEDASIGTELVFSPIHLLAKSKRNRIMPSNFKGDFGDAILFTNYNGRCLPDPNGTSIEKCLEKTFYKEQPLFLSNIPKRYFTIETLVVLFLLFIPALFLFWI